MLRFWQYFIWIEKPGFEKKRKKKQIWCLYHINISRQLEHRNERQSQYLQPAHGETTESKSKQVYINSSWSELCWRLLNLQQCQLYLKKISNSEFNWNRHVVQCEGMDLYCHFHFYFLVRIIANELKIRGNKRIYVLLLWINFQNLQIKEWYQ